MTDERTEEAAFSGLLNFKVGGKNVELRVLTIEESDAWQRKLGVSLGGLDVPEATDDGGVAIGNMLVAGTAAKLEMVLAYDVEERLGSRESVRKRMTKAELTTALDAILDAENPKEEAANRSVAAAFGQQSLMLSLGLEAAQKAAASYLANTTNGRSPIGRSTPELSAVGSPTSSSSSSGPTDKTASNGRHKSKASSTKSPRPTATPT